VKSLELGARLGLGTRSNGRRRSETIFNVGKCNQKHRDEFQKIYCFSFHAETRFT
jgi:hypothetical protein